MNRLSYYGMTDHGRCRENNEDAYLLDQNGRCVIAAVADGIGGYEGGEVASYLACKCMSDYLRDTPDGDFGADVLKQAVIYANNAVVSQQQNPRLCNMGCVLTAVLFDMERNLAYMCMSGIQGFTAIGTVRSSNFLKIIRWSEFGKMPDYCLKWRPCLIPNAI